MGIFVNTYLMKPHTVMGSFLYEAVLETQENKLVAQNFDFGPLKFLF